MGKNILLLCFAFFGSIGFAQTIPEVPSDKAVVYFVRPNGLGALVNFTYFDGDTVIGRFNAPKYLRYECEPGEHLFWARSENTSYIEATLSAGKMYLIEAVPQMGGLKAAVKLVPVDVTTHKMKPIQKLLAKRDSEMFSTAELSALADKKDRVKDRASEKYQDIKDRGKNIAQLTEGMTFTHEDLVLEKKE